MTIEQNYLAMPGLNFGDSNNLRKDSIAQVSKALGDFVTDANDTQAKKNKYATDQVVQSIFQIDPNDQEQLAAVTGLAKEFENKGAFVSGDIVGETLAQRSKDLSGLAREASLTNSSNYALDQTMAADATANVAMGTNGGLMGAEFLNDLNQQERSQANFEQEQALQKEKFNFEKENTALDNQRRDNQLDLDIYKAFGDSNSNQGGGGFAFTSPQTSNVGSLGKGKLIRKSDGTYTSDSPFLAAVINIESSGKANAVNGQHKGLLQIGSAALTDVNAALGTKYSTKDMSNPEINFKVGTKYMSMVANQLGKKGIEATPANIYLGHQQGVGGLSQLYRVSSGSGRLGSEGRTAAIGNLPESERASASKLNDTALANKLLNHWTTTVNKKLGQSIAPTVSESPEAVQAEFANAIKTKDFVRARELSKQTNAPVSPFASPQDEQEFKSYLSKLGVSSQAFNELSTQKDGVKKQAKFLDSYVKEQEAVQKVLTDAVTQPNGKAITSFYPNSAADKAVITPLNPPTPFQKLSISFLDAMPSEPAFKNLKGQRATNFTNSIVESIGKTVDQWTKQAVEAKVPDAALIKLGTGDLDTIREKAKAYYSSYDKSKTWGRSASDDDLRQMFIRANRTATIEVLNEKSDDFSSKLKTARNENPTISYTSALK